jgi:hypothetical protein
MEDIEKVFWHLRQLGGQCPVPDVSQIAVRTPHCEMSKSGKTAAPAIVRRSEPMIIHAPTPKNSLYLKDRRKLLEACGCFTVFDGKNMSQFSAETVRAMRAALAEVCRHIPMHSADTRAFIASKILECAFQGEKTYDGLLQAGRRAVIARFGTVSAVRVARSDDGLRGGFQPKIEGRDKLHGQRSG